jgi:phosphopantetheinyl transferase
VSEQENRRTHHIWGRVAAKEAIRRLWLAEGEGPRYPADLAIEVEPDGRPRIRDLAAPDRDDSALLSFATSGGVAIAIAARSDAGLVGIDLEEIETESASRDATLLTVREQSLVARLSTSSHQEWHARVRCAKRAAAKALGLDPDRPSLLIEVVAIDESSGEMTVEIVDVPFTESNPRTMEIRVQTHRRDEYAWAWTLGERE